MSEFFINHILGSRMIAIELMFLVYSVTTLVPKFIKGLFS